MCLFSILVLAEGSWSSAASGLHILYIVPHGNFLGPERNPNEEGEPLFSPCSHLWFCSRNQFKHCRNWLNVFSISFHLLESLVEPCPGCGLVLASVGLHSSPGDCLALFHFPIACSQLPRVSQTWHNTKHSYHAIFLDNIQETNHLVICHLNYHPGKMAVGNLKI